MNWRDRAACGSQNPRLWDLDAGGPLVELGKRICGQCPVQRPCIEEAARLRENGVVRGGVAFTGQDVVARRCWRCGRWFAPKRKSQRRFCREACVPVRAAA